APSVAPDVRVARDLREALDVAPHERDELLGRSEYRIDVLDGIGILERLRRGYALRLFAQPGEHGFRRARRRDEPVPCIDAVAGVPQLGNRRHVGEEARAL